MKIEIMSAKEVAKLQPRKVYEIFEHVRAKICHIYNHYDMMNRCCEVCCEYIGSDKEWEENVVSYAKPLEKFRDILKAELKRRPYAKLTKAQKAQARKTKIADLKGNKRRRK